MALKDIQNEINSRYSEIYNRIEKYFDKFKYVTYNDEEWFLYDWYFNYEEGIEVLMRDSDGYENTAYIDPNFLETDEVFEEWLDDECAQREEKNWKTNKLIADKDMTDFEKYQELKAKFEK